MTITIQLPPELERALQARAAGRGLDLEAFVLESLRATLGRPPEMERGDGESPAPEPAAAEEADDESPWRGAFPLEPPRRELFTQEVNLRTSALPRWQPEVVISPRWVRD